MATVLQLEALVVMYHAARLSGHLFPAVAACEAVEETRWGLTELCVNDFNIFGRKRHAHPVFGTVNLPTNEFLHHQWEVVHADFVIRAEMSKFDRYFSSTAITSG
jgi:hypothetical protein